MHVAQLRRELGDQLFTRTASGLAFTPGGLRLASRAVEILGLQDRTVREVSQAGHGRRLLRLATSSLFAEHAAPGLIELFAGRADDLDVELSVQPSSRFPALLTSRTVDLAIGPMPAQIPDDLVHKPFLNYDVLAVAGPEHPLAGCTISKAHARAQTWFLGPSASSDAGAVPGMLRHLGVPDEHQRIFQSDAAALAETKRSRGIALALRFTVAGDLEAGRLAIVEGPGMRAQGRWAAMALPAHSQLPATAELLRFITTPRATQAMVRGSGVEVGRFRPSVHVTLWS
jgi:DNA-binding transcriptional LysR family regulator